MHQVKVHRVRVEPVGVEFGADEGQTLMEAAHEAGYYWPTVCGGQGSCRTCFVHVLSGGQDLSPVGGWEAEGLATLPRAGDHPVRLACQARVGGDMTVRKAGVRPARRT